MDPKKKKPINYGNAFEEAKGLLWHSRARLSVGLGLMLVNRLTGLVLPASTKFLVDDVIGKNQPQLLWPLALAVGVATLIESATSFAISQVLGVAAQRAITEMRRSVQA
ncbi:MAG: ABC transporter ATP-binding protein, partial [Luteitalea sp.]